MVALGDSLTYGWMVDRGCLDFLGDMMRERFPEARFRLIHCGMPAGTAYNGLHRLPLAQVHSYWKGKLSEGGRFDDLVQTDRVHPTSQGYRFMAEAIMGVFL